MISLVVTGPRGSDVGHRFHDEGAGRDAIVDGPLGAAGFAQADDDPHLIVFDTSLKKEDISIEQVVIDGEPYRAGQIYVRFDPLGASSSHSIHLRQNIFDREFTIEVLPLTGDIRFHDGPFQRDPPEDSDFQ